MGTLYLAQLMAGGVSAKLRARGVLRLEPRSAITEEIDKLVREHKADIIAELLDLSGPRYIPCPECHWRRVQLLPMDKPAEDDALRWYQLAYSCGYEGRMTERDYQMWMGFQILKNQK